MVWTCVHGSHLVAWQLYSMKGSVATKLSKVCAWPFAWQFSTAVARVVLVHDSLSCTQTKWEVTWGFSGASMAVCMTTTFYIEHGMILLQGTTF